MQAWGVDSRFTRRETRSEPTKSGVLGLLAAAQGRRRTDSVEDLLALKFGVRVDQSGQVIRDFQTAQRWDTGRRMPLSYRYYLADAVFVAGVEGPPEVIEGLANALQSPAFPIFLGRRSCPPSRPVLLDVLDTDLLTSMRSAEWQAADWYRRTKPKEVVLRLVVDADVAGDGGIAETLRDVPLSFDPVRRDYEWREVVEIDRGVGVANEVGRARPAATLDYFQAVSVG